MAFGKDDVFKKIKRLVTYCGDYLKCLNIKKGDSYDTVFKKLDDVVCDLFRRMDALDSPTIISNPSCPNGGFVLLDGDGNVAFADCYPDKTDIEFIDSTTCEGFDVFIDGQKVYTYCENEFILSFQSSVTCSNGGFDVLDLNSNIIFSQCYPDNYTESEIVDIIKDNLNVLVDNQTIRVNPQGKLYAYLGLPLVLTVDNTTSGKDIEMSTGDLIKGVAQNSMDFNSGSLQDDITLISPGKLALLSGIVRKMVSTAPGTVYPSKGDYFITVSAGNPIHLNSSILGEEFIFYNEGKNSAILENMSTGNILTFPELSDKTLTIPTGGIVKVLSIGIDWLVIYKNF